MLDVGRLGYDSWATVLFQRTTVIASELVLCTALIAFVRSTPAIHKQSAQAAALSIMLSPGLLIIDHIHFQYNGFLYGVLIWSLVLLRNESTMLFGAIMFAALLCMKHIYLYLAPAYFVYLLRAYCLGKKSIYQIRFGNTAKLGFAVMTVFGLAFGPFAHLGQLSQLRDRLFPFSRGLCHAYWAPNIWAMYSFTDRVLLHGKRNGYFSRDSLADPIIAAPILNLKINDSAVQSVTRGLVGDSTFAILPEITPTTTFILTLFFQCVSCKHFSTIAFSAKRSPDLLGQTFLSTFVGHLYWRSYPLWLCVLPFWMARS